MKLSIIIPVYNGGDDFALCLRALSTSEKLPEEIIVVNDASTDNSAQIAAQFGAHVLNLGETPMGPAVARNRGAAIAREDVIVFLDADVAIHQDTLMKIAEKMDLNPGISAVFGSYDNAPLKQGFVSRYKNLQHHYIHQNSQRDASTFWAGCGAIYRDVFIKMGGFDEGYIRPSIEDIELGMRLTSFGYQIWLCPDIQVKHLKRWTFLGLLRSDVRDRALPWSKLLVTSPKIHSDLNLNKKSRFSALAVWMSLLSLTMGFYHPFFWLISTFCLSIVIFLNFDLYKLYFKQGGFFFLFISIILHCFYYIYSSFTFAVVYLQKVIVDALKKTRTFTLNR